MVSAQGPGTWRTASEVRSTRVSNEGRIIYTAIIN